MARCPWDTAGARVIFIVAISLLSGHPQSGIEAAPREEEVEAMCAQGEVSVSLCCIVLLWPMCARTASMTHAREVHSR
jgi:hypothetical protein